jgi:hypothetical protein
MSFYTADQVAGVALKLVEADLNLALLVDRTFESAYVPGAGKTVYVRVPAAAVARPRDLDQTSTQVVYDKLSETVVPVTLSTQAHSGVILSDADMTLNLQDFSAQVLAPQAAAVADYVENALAGVLNAVTPETGFTFAADAPVKALTALRRALRDRGVDFSDDELKVAVVGGNVLDVLMDSGALDYDKTGDAEALRSGSVGRLRGFQIVESNRIDANAIIGFPKHGVHLAGKAPAATEGIPFASTVKSENGVSLRYARGYDFGVAAEKSLVSTFVGAVAMPAYRAVRTYTAGSEAVSVEEIDGGHIVALDTSAA